MATTKSRVTVYFAPEVWQAFRIGCLTRRVSASRQLGILVAELLRQWNTEEDQEPPHLQRTTADQRP